MAHQPKPFFRTARAAWYVQFGKQQVRLCGGPKSAATEKAAWDAFHALMAERAKPAPTAPTPTGIPVPVLFDKFLDWTQKHRDPGTYRWYHDHIQEFLDALAEPNMPAADLRPYHVIEWVDAHPGWGDTSRRQAIVAIQRPFNWAFKLGYIPANPLHHVEKPKARRREQAVSPEDFAKIVGHYKDGDPFRDLLTFAWETGMRPQEVTRVEARHVDLTGLLIVFPPREAKGKTRHRRVLLTTPAAAILKPLVEKYPDGPLFRNADGEPWTRFAVNCRFGRLKKKLGVKFCTYALRHGFCQRLLEAGTDHLTVAELMGHADGTMVARVYSHMNQRDDHLRAALNKRGA